MVTPREMAVDLSHLWEVGAYHLPSVAQIHSAAAATLHTCAYYDGNVMYTPGTTTRSPAFEKFVALRDALQVIAANSSDNIVLTGAGLLRVVEDFTSTDGHNATELTLAAADEMDDMNDDHRERYGEPPKVPNPPEPGDPQPTTDPQNPGEEGQR